MIFGFVHKFYVGDKYLYTYYYMCIYIYIYIYICNYMYMHEFRFCKSCLLVYWGKLCGDYKKRCVFLDPVINLPTGIY